MIRRIILSSIVLVGLTGSVFGQETQASDSLREVTVYLRDGSHGVSHRRPRGGAVVQLFDHSSGAG
ncbi:MAG: hypothetical protein AAF223_17610, partial [Bacteroidota bacterium]